MENQSGEIVTSQRSHDESYLLVDKTLVNEGPDYQIVNRIDENSSSPLVTEYGDVSKADDGAAAVNMDQNVRQTKLDDRSIPDLFKDESTGSIYITGSLLGKGGYGKVYLVEDAHSKEYLADKVIDRSMINQKLSARQKVLREIDLHSQMNHENVIQFLTCFEDDQFVHIILELAPQGSLLHVNKMRKRITEYEMRYYIRQIFAGTNYIHSLSILHRDLKLSNMLLSADMVVKIGDFGLATTFEDDQSGSRCGTPNYIAPEILALKGHSISTEIWSIGCMIYALLCGTPPFESESVNTTYVLISNCDYTISSNLNLSYAAVDLIKTMLNPDPNYRGFIGDSSVGQCGPNLWKHRFLKEGFTPVRIPPSAINTTPYLDRATSVPGSITGCPEDQKNSEHNQSKEFNQLSISSSPVSSNESSSVMNSHNKSAVSRRTFIALAKDGLKKSLSMSSRDKYNDSEDLKVVPVFVSKWVDYTNKFGFGFQMSDGSIGIRFNDSSSVGLSADLNSVEFIDINGNTFVYPYDKYEEYVFPEVAERIDILKYFVRYMSEQLADSITFIPGKDTVSSCHQKTKNPHLLSWKRDKQFVFIELNNMTLQRNGLDDHVKSVLWRLDQDILMSIFTSSTSCSTYSLSSPCPVVFKSQYENMLDALQDKSGETEVQKV